MRKILTLIVPLFFTMQVLFAQQDAMFTKYMFNSLIYNPAYAGAKDHMAIGLLHRTQWWGIDGAPSTQSFTFHTPLKMQRVGVGLSAVNDVIGPTKSIGGNVAFAYRIPMGEKGKLSIGLRGGVTNWRADWDKLDLQTNQDDAFSDTNPSVLIPNFGAGIYYYNPKFYIGFSSPSMLEWDLREDINSEIWAKTYRHYYLMAGAAFPINGDALIFKPSFLIKNVGLLSSFSKEDSFKNIGAPTEFDIDLSFMFYQAFWIGASFRSAIEYFDDSSSFDSADIWASYYLANGLRIGAAYDYTLTKLQKVAKGSFEVMLGYEFNYRTKKAVTPRYF